MSDLHEDAREPWARVTSRRINATFARHLAQTQAEGCERPAEEATARTIAEEFSGKHPPVRLVREIPCGCATDGTRCKEHWRHDRA